MIDEAQGGRYKSERAHRSHLDSHSQSQPSSSPAPRCAKSAMAWQAYDVPAYGAPRSPTVWTVLLTFVLAGTVLAFASLFNSP